MSTLIYPKTIKVDGLSVRYAEGGQAGPDAILMSPWPESVYAFEPAWPHLAPMFNVPIFGHEEDAADNFATFIPLQFGKGQARRLINGAAWAWRAYLGDYQKNPVVPTRLAAFASDHGLPQERFYNLVCLASGANRQEFADFVSFLPPTRSPNCSHEYQTLVRAFRQEIRPHIDMEQARVVLDTDWLKQLETEPLPQK